MVTRDSRLTDSVKLHRGRRTERAARRNGGAVHALGYALLMSRARHGGPTIASSGGPGASFNA